MSTEHTNVLNLKLPNGLVGLATGPEAIRNLVIRDLDGDDEDMLRDQENLEEGDILIRLLKRIIIKIGSEEAKEAIAKLFDRHLLLADFTFILVKMRCHFIDDIYRYDYSCPKCTKLNRYRVELLKLKVDEQLDEFRGLKELTVTSKGHVVEFKQLLTTRDTPLLQSIKEDYPKEKSTRELLIQLLKFDDEPMNSPTLKKLSWKKRNTARRAMDTGCGGIDIVLEMKCKRCSATFKDNMPIQLRDFFFPEEEEYECWTARPFRVSGTTPCSSGQDGIGDPERSAPSP